MNPFKSYTFTWWQIGILKFALLFLGIAIGAHWYEFFSEYITLLIILAAITSFYMAYISFQQQGSK